MADGSRFGMVENEWSKVECKRGAHRALSESVMSVMSLRRERELSGGVEPLCMCALDLLRVGRHVALQQAWSSEQAVERVESRGHGPLCAFARAVRAVAMGSAARHERNSTRSRTLDHLWMASRDHPRHRAIFAAVTLGRHSIK